MRIAIIGSRNFSALYLIDRFVSCLPKDFVIVSGGAAGVDITAEKAAIKAGLKVLIFQPEWEKYGKRAAFLRNQTIVDNADMVVAYWDGNSKGTKMTITLARKAGIPVKIIQRA